MLQQEWWPRRHTPTLPGVAAEMEGEGLGQGMAWMCLLCHWRENPGWPMEGKGGRMSGLARPKLVPNLVHGWVGPHESVQMGRPARARHIGTPVRLARFGTFV
jgi:hypothetical protein